MFFADEVRDPSEHRPKKQKLSESELEMARELIDRMAGDFDPAKYEDTYRAKLLKVIRQKAKGKPVKVAEPRRPEQPPDLIDALRASLAEGRATPGGGRRAKKGGSSRKSARSRKAHR